MDDFARMGGINPKGAYMVLAKFIIQHNQLLNETAQLIKISLQLAKENERRHGNSKDSSENLSNILNNLLVAPKS